MDTREVDGLRLSWECDSQGARLEVRDGAGRQAPADLRSAFRLGLLGHRLGLAMAFLPTSKVIDVSIQPMVVAQALGTGGRSCRRGSSGSVVATWVARLAELSSVWRPADPDVAGVNGTIGGAAFPLLGAAYDRGASPLDEIPRWAAPLLSRPTARAAAGAAFGSNATRPVVASLAASLVPATSDSVVERPGGGAAASDGGRTGVRLLPLGCALMGSTVLEPDRLVRVLAAGHVGHGPASWPTREQVAAFRQVAPLLGAVRTERLLCETLSRVGGPQMLFELVETLPHVGHLLPRGIANRLEDLVGQCRNLVPVDPDPRLRGTQPLRTRTVRAVRPRAGVRRAQRPARAGTRSAAGVVPAGPPTARPDPRRRALLPPPQPEGVLEAVVPWRLPRSVVDLHGVTIGDELRLLVPRTAAELVTWGGRLGNCVGRYGPAVSTGRSLLFGVEVDGMLRYCLELEANGSVRQFLGEGNRPVPTIHARAVCRHLASVRLVDPDRPANRVWLDGDRRRQGPTVTHASELAGRPQG